MTQPEALASRGTKEASVEDGSVVTSTLSSWAIARKRLVEALSTSAAGIVVMNAAAGYGKSTTIALWNDADDRPFATVRLEPSDDDPVTLLQHVAVALEAIEPLPTALGVRLTTPGCPVETELLPGLREELAARHPMVLVLDDIHILRSQEAIRCLDGLVSWMPQGSQVVLAGRSMPPIPLARHRLAEGVLELTAADFAFDDTEVEELLATVGLEAGDDLVSALLEQTEGWATGVFLASLTMQEGAGRWQVRDRVPAQSQRGLAEYLVDEVLESLPSELVSFLERSSILDRMTTSLLDDLLETTDSAQRLDEFAHRAAGFLVHLDDRNEWTRYHHLFAELLADRMRGSAPETMLRLHRRASALLEERGDIDGAIRQAVRADDISRASDLLLSQAVPMALGGRSARLRTWLGLLKEDDIAEHPSAAITLGWCAVSEGDQSALQGVLDIVDGSEHQGPLCDGSPSLTVAAAVLRSVMGASGVQGVIADTEIARQGGPAKTNPWWAVATLLQGTAFENVGDFDRARDLIHSALPEVVGLPAYECGAQGHLSIMACHDGDLIEAERRSSRALGLVEEHRLEAVLPMAPILANGAHLHALAGRTDEADRATSAATALLARLGHLSPRTALLSYVLLARSAMALGRFADARGFHREAKRAREMDDSATELAGQVDELSDRLSVHDDIHSTDGAPLTAAELRVLAFLPTHLSIGEIAERLEVSRNTTKSQSVAIYRKLSVSSRSEAVEAARRVGLLDDLRSVLD